MRKSTNALGHKPKQIYDKADDFEGDDSGMKTFGLAEVVDESFETG